MTISLQHSPLTRVGKVSSKSRFANLAASRHRYIEKSIFLGQILPSNRGLCDDSASAPRFTSEPPDDNKENHNRAAHNVGAIRDTDRSW